VILKDITEASPQIASSLAGAFASAIRSAICRNISRGYGFRELGAWTGPLGRYPAVTNPGFDWKPSGRQIAQAGSKALTLLRRSFRSRK